VFKAIFYFKAKNAFYIQQKIQKNHLKETFSTLGVCANWRLKKANELVKNMDFQRNASYFCDFYVYLTA